MRWLATILIVVLAAGAAVAETYNTPIVDGTITIGPSDWDETDHAFNEAADDNRYYPDDPDLTDLYVTWNADTLYVGVITERDPGGYGNGYLVFIDVDAQAGITGATDFSSADYFPRKITFSTIGVDVVVGGWSLPENMDVKHVMAGATTAPIPGAYGKADAVAHHIEAAIPWAGLYARARTPVPVGTTLRFIAAIVGGDNSGAYDAMPTSTSGDESNSETPWDAVIDLDLYREVVVDGDSDGVPDPGYTPVEPESWGKVKSLFAE